MLSMQQLADAVCTFADNHDGTHHAEAVSPLELTSSLTCPLIPLLTGEFSPFAPLPTNLGVGCVSYFNKNNNNSNPSTARRHPSRAWHMSSTDDEDETMSFATPLSVPPPHATHFDVVTCIHNPSFTLGELTTTPIPTVTGTAYMVSPCSTSSFFTPALHTHSCTGPSVGASSLVCKRRERMRPQPLLGLLENDACNEHPTQAAVLSPLLVPVLEAEREENRGTHWVRRVLSTVAHTTMGGPRRTQEDAVCIHEHVPFPSDTIQRAGLPEGIGSSLYGVFDGHNGDTISNFASLYFLEHFSDALSRASHSPQSKTEQGGIEGSSSLREVDNVPQDQEHPQQQQTEAHTEEKEVDKLDSAPLMEKPLPHMPQRFVSSALVQALIHLDRTVYDNTRPPQHHCAGTTASIAAFYHVPHSNAAIHANKAHTDPDGFNRSHDTTCYLSIANLGDSRSVLARRSDGHVLLSTVDHRVPAYPAERTRVERCGGCIECDRVDGALEVTRSLGDFAYKLPPECWWDSTKEETTPTRAVELFVDPKLSPESELERSSLHCLDDFCAVTPITSPNARGPLFACGSPDAFSARNLLTCLDDLRVDNLFKPLSGQTKKAEIHSPSTFETMAQGGNRLSLAQNVVSNVADIYEAELTGDEFLVMATDGLWDRMTTEEVVQFVRNRLARALRRRRPSLSLTSPNCCDTTQSPHNGIPSETFHQWETATPTCAWRGGPATPVQSKSFQMEHFGNAPIEGGEEEGYEARRHGPIPRYVLQEVANSLAEHVVHDLRGADNVTILLLAFHTEEVQVETGCPSE